MPLRRPNIRSITVRSNCGRGAAHSKATRDQADAMSHRWVVLDKKSLAVFLLVYFTVFETAWRCLARSLSPFAAPTAEAQEYSSSELFSQEQLDNLLAPIALYPDPLLAQLLLAATFVDQLSEASRWMRAHNNPKAIDDQPWDVSVKAIAHYPSVLYMMGDQLDWTASVGQAYVYQSTDVMTAIQRLRARAYSTGNLVTNEQQQVEVNGDTLNIVPAQPTNIYVPAYDPNIIYFGPASYFGLHQSSILSFGPAFPIGAWLNHDCDWRRRRIYYHGWRGGSWIARSRPVIRVTTTYVNNRYSNVQINRSVVQRHVNYASLNRYNSVHRSVNYNNVTRVNRSNTGKVDTGNKIIKRDPDASEQRLDSHRGKTPVQEPATRANKVPLSPTKPQPAAAPQQPPADTQQAPNAPSGADPRDASQRGQQTRGRANQPTARPGAPTPNAPATRSMPSAPTRP